MAKPAHVTSAIEGQPVSAVVWRHREELSPNDFNPNKVAAPEMKLLITSILEDGWTQPIVILPDMTIVDGFHRYTVSGYPELEERFGGWVPTVIVDADPLHHRMSTIRHNRARGTHGVVPMADIVRFLSDQGADKEEIMKRLSMEDEEVDRLLDRAGMPSGGGKDNFGHAWRPKAN